MPVINIKDIKVFGSREQEDRIRKRISKLKLTAFALAARHRANRFFDEPSLPYDVIDLIDRIENFLNDGDLEKAKNIVRRIIVWGFVNSHIRVVRDYLMFYEDFLEEKFISSGERKKFEEAVVDLDFIFLKKYFFNLEGGGFCLENQVSKGKLQVNKKMKSLKTSSKVKSSDISSEMKKKLKLNLKN